MNYLRLHALCNQLVNVAIKNRDEIPGELATAISDIEDMTNPINLDKKKEDKVEKACDECGGTNVNARGYIVWDYELQRWVVDDYEGDAYCSDCENDCNIQDI